jgi:hypothetical protein
LPEPQLHNFQLITLGSTLAPLALHCRLERRFHF